MTYQEATKILDKNHVGNLVRTISQMYEEMRQENFIKWIDDYPEYWLSICNMNVDEITPEYAEEVMNTLIDSNIVELQMMWLFKCGDSITLNGKANSENFSNLN